MSVSKKIISVGLTCVIMSGMFCSCTPKVLCENVLATNSKNDSVITLNKDNTRLTASSENTVPHDQERKDEEKKSKINTFIATNLEFLPRKKISEIRNRLMKLSIQEIESLNSLDFNDPTFFSMVSVFWGLFGANQFMFELTSKVFLLKGVLICLIWDIVVWFIVGGITKEKNYKILKSAIETYES